MAFGRWQAQLNAQFKPQQGKTCWLMPYEGSKQSKSWCSCKAGWTRTQPIPPCSIGFAIYWSNEGSHEGWPQGFYPNCMQLGNQAETRNSWILMHPCSTRSLWTHNPEANTSVAWIEQAEYRRAQRHKDLNNNSDNAWTQNRKEAKKNCQHNTGYCSSSSQNP